MALVSDSRSDWKRKIGLVWLVAALAVPACGDDAGSSDDDTGTTEEPTTGDDAAVGDDDDDTKPGDDDQGDDDQGDDDDDGPSIDGGARDSGARDAGRLDAGRTDASASDAGAGDAGDEPADSGASDASVVDASTGIDAGRDASTDASSSDASADAARDAGRDASTRPDQGRGDGRDVVLIGDSWMDNNLVARPAGIGPSLIEVAMRPYRNHAVEGSRMLERGLLLNGPIPSQFDDALRENMDIKTVVMTGGGNDVILDPGVSADCRRGGERCQARLDEVGRALKALWDRMGAAGVDDIIHILYADVAGDVQNIEENNQAVRNLCAAVTSARCHIFDSNEIVTMESQLADGIHPTVATNRRLATAIYEYMEEQGIRR